MKYAWINARNYIILFQLYCFLLYFKYETVDLFKIFPLEIKR